MLGKRYIVNGIAVCGLLHCRLPVYLTIECSRIFRNVCSAQKKIIWSKSKEIFYLTSLEFRCAKTIAVKFELFLTSIFCLTGDKHFHFLPGGKKKSLFRREFTEIICSTNGTGADRTLRKLSPMTFSAVIIENNLIINKMLHSNCIVVFHISSMCVRGAF